MVKVTFDYSLLRGRIFSKYMSLSEFGAAIGTKVEAISAKLLSGRPFNTAVAFIWAKALDIKADEYGIYFFTPKVAYKQLMKGEE